MFWTPRQKPSPERREMLLPVPSITHPCTAKPVDCGTAIPLTLKAVTDRIGRLNGNSLDPPLPSCVSLKSQIETKGDCWTSPFWFPIPVSHRNSELQDVMQA